MRDLPWQLWLQKPGWSGYRDSTSSEAGQDHNGDLEYSWLRGSLAVSDTSKKKKKTTHKTQNQRWFPGTRARVKDQGLILKETGNDLFGSGILLVMKKYT